MKKYLLKVAVGVVCLVITAIAIENIRPLQDESHMLQNQAPIAKLQQSEADEPPLEFDSVSGNNVHYMIVMEENMLCTYEINSEKKTLLRKAELEPLLVSENDYKKLKQGIYSQDLEEIYLYYESYAS